MQRFLKYLGFGLAGLCLALAFTAVALWIVVTQPFYTRSATASVASGSNPAIDPARLETHVRLLSAQPFDLRNASRPAILNNAGTYIRNEFAKIAKTRGVISEQTFEVDGDQYKNIVISFAARNKNDKYNRPDTAGSEERIVVGAHYDAAEGTPGADDNASGVAGLIELARLLDERPLPLPVDLIVYTLEEPPYFRTPDMGSARHAAMLRGRNTPVRAMLALEMIGYFSEAPGSQDYPFPFLLRRFYPDEGNFIAVAGRVDDAALTRTVKAAMQSASPLPVYSINAPRWVPGLDFSDHLNYWNENYPAVMITDTAFYRNRNYHQYEDTAEKLDYRKMALVVAGVYQALEAIATD